MLWGRSTLDSGLVRLFAICSFGETSLECQHVLLLELFPSILDPSAKTHEVHITYSLLHPEPDITIILFFPHFSTPQNEETKHWTLQSFKKQVALNPSTPSPNCVVLPFPKDLCVVWPVFRSPNCTIRQVRTHALCRVSAETCQAGGERRGGDL